MRALDTDVDVAEHGTLAVALVFDDKLAILQADLIELIAIEAECPQAVDPGEQRTKVLGPTPQERFRLRLDGGCDGWRGDGSRRIGRHRRWPLICGQKRELAIGSNPDRQRGADELDARGTRTSGQKA